MTGISLKAMDSSKEVLRITVPALSRIISMSLFALCLLSLALLFLSRQTPNYQGFPLPCDTRETLEKPGTIPK